MNAVLNLALRRWQLDDAEAPGCRMLERLAQRDGTPLYVHSRPLIEARVAALRAELPDGLALLYAVKANPDPAVVGCVVPIVDGCDVTSATEIAVALQAGAEGHALSLAGPGKSDAELAAAVAANALVVVESPGEARRLAAFAASGVRPRVALRINPPFTLAADARMGGGSRRFGVDSEQAPQVLAEIGRLPLAFEGFHVFAGSGCLDARAIAKAQQATLELACELAAFAPATVRVLNLGGGFGVPCFEGDEPLALATLGASLRALAADAVRRLPGVRLALELGRYLVAEAGLYLTRVLDRKESRGRVFLIVDGGANHHWHATGALEGRRHLHFPLTVVGGEGRAVERVTLCGPLCAPHDTWAEDIALPAAVPGDLVAVFQSGAYGASASPQAFLGKPPAVERLVEWPARQPADARIETSPHRRQETEHA
ncbi:alanine racemase [Aromatoleum sp.]|uniref:alanine racemase n=1 Tax=Aromatoleum sp. TaxID=2307007 RepID=UPI002FC790E5